METPRLSVALCTYNGGQYLAEQLESIAGQTLPVDEIILCDDGSTDQTLAIAQHFLTQGLPITIHRNPQRLGFIENFSQAIRLCSGDIIFLCDQDDLWMPNKVKEITQVFTRSPTTWLVFSDGELVDSATQPLDCRLWQALPTYPSIHPAFQELLNNDWITGAACAFRKELVDHALPIPESWVHDAWLGLIASAYGEVEALPEPLIAYRQHAHNQIGLPPPSLRQAFRKIIRLLTTSHTETPEKYLMLPYRLPINHPLQELVTGKLRHLHNRQVHTQRLKGIGTEILNRGYWQYARGWRSIIRDLGLLTYQTIQRIPPASAPK
jgi:glycosyltransferase involved in cell wall biosynthesis